MKKLTTYKEGLRVCEETSERLKENKRDRFKRIATNRTNAVLDKIRILGNCSNKAFYDYTLEEQSQIFKRILEEVVAVQNQFLEPQKPLPFCLTTQGDL